MTVERPQKFPTVFREAKFHETDDAVLFEGERWIVGEGALTDLRSCYYIRTVSELIEFYPLFLLEVKRRFGIEGNKVAITLPLDTYIIEKTKREKGENSLLDEVEENCKKYGFQQVKVFPQGILGLQALISRGEVEREDTLVIDGGFNTVNVSVVSKDDSKDDLSVKFFKTFTDEVGIRNLIEEFFVEELKQKYSSITTNLVILKEIFLREKIDTGLKIESVKLQKNRAIKRFIRKFFRKITGELSRAGVGYSQIVIVGGLSYYLKKDFFDTNKKLFIPQEGGEFLNLMGLPVFWKEADFFVDLGFGDCKSSI